MAFTSLPRGPGARRANRRGVDWSRWRTGAEAGPTDRPPLLERPWLRELAWTATAFVALVVVLRVVLPRDVPFGLLLFGTVVGSINALIAVGLILVYRSNRIINFAQAEIGVFGGIVFENLVRGTGIPWIVSLPLGFVASAGLAGVAEYLIVRRFAKAPRLILTVVTIGLAQIVVVVTYLTASLFPRQSGSSLKTPLSGIDFFISQVRFSGDHVLLLASVPLIVLALNLFLKRTDFGVAVRASAELADRAALLGVPVKRVSTVMWVVAGGMTGLATMLRSPVVGLVSGASLQGPGLLLRALAAAVLAKMDNIRTAVLAALAIGIVEQALYFAYGGSSISDVVFVAIIIGGLLLQRRTGGRSADGGDSSWSAFEEVRAIPAQLRHLPEVRWGKVAIAALVGIPVLTFPLYASPSKENLASAMVIYAIVAVSLVVLTGWAGQISLGQFGIVGLGAGVAGRVSADAGADFLVAMVAGGLAGAAVALVLGVAALRIKGFFFAVTSLGFAVAMESYFLNEQFFSYLVPTNRPERPVLLDRFDLESEAAFYWFSLVVLAGAVLVTRRLRASRTGRVLVAVRDNEKAAQAFGIDQVRAKLTAFAISGVLAGVAGALLAVHQHAVSPSAFNPNESLRVFSMVVIGGLGSIPGAILGAVFVRGSAFLLPQQLAILASGLGLLVVLLVLPGGLGRLVFAGRDRLLLLLAERKGIIVPSLVADVRRTPEDPVPDPVVAAEHASADAEADGHLLVGGAG